LKTDRNFTIERERPERDDEPGYSTFLSAAAEMPTFSDAELKGLDLVELRRACPERARRPATPTTGSSRTRLPQPSHRSHLSLIPD
jgi:hypothetical protein